MKILALDLGTKTGWAIGDKDDPNELIYSGMQKFDLKRGESPGMRYLRFGTWLQDMFLSQSFDFVVYEQTHHRGGYATEVSGAFKGVLQMTCAKHSVEFVPVHSGTLKKFATGHGKASKDMMINVADTRFSRIVKTDDEADALMLWEMANKGEV